MSAGTPAPSRGDHKEAVYVFTATVVVLVVIIAALNLGASGRGEDDFGIASGDFIDYSINGKVGEIMVGGAIRFYFVGQSEGALDSFIVTLSELSPLDSAAPFSDDPLLTSKHFDYDGFNLTCIGEMLISRLPQYTGSNSSGMGNSAFGTLVDHQMIQTSLGGGQTAHYINSSDSVTLEQWVLAGTGLPIKLEYADAGGTELTFSGWESNIDWIVDLNG